MNKVVKRITASALFVALLVAADYALHMIPGLQLVTLVITVIFYALGFWNSLLVVGIYVLIDSIIEGGLSLVFTPVMFIGWVWLLLLLLIVRKKQIAPALAFIGFFHSFLYSWTFIPASVLFYDLSFWAYFLADIPWEIGMAVSSFLSIIVLVRPLLKATNRFMNYYEVTEVL